MIKGFVLGRKKKASKMELVIENLTQTFTKNHEELICEYEEIRSQYKKLGVFKRDNQSDELNKQYRQLSEQVTNLINKRFDQQEELKGQFKKLSSKIYRRHSFSNSLFPFIRRRRRKLSRKIENQAEELCEQSRSFRKEMGLMYDALRRHAGIPDFNDRVTSSREDSYHECYFTEYNKYGVPIISGPYDLADLPFAPSKETHWDELWD